MIWFRKDEAKDREKVRFIIENYISSLIIYGNKLPDICKDQELSEREQATAMAIDDLEKMLENLDYMFTRPDLVKYVSKTINRCKKHIDKVNKVIGQ